MIRLRRSRPAPAVLEERGRQARARMERAYDEAPAEYDARRRTFTFAGSVYAHETVTRALVQMQHGKCAFCESRVREDGDVEHYRPKSAFTQDVGGRLEGPGYYWLAYEWDNLLLACSTCNQRHKRNRFPLADPSRRARSHRADLRAEAPLLLDPCADAPEAHLSFRREVPFAVGGSPRGAATIALLGLGRESLNERRRDRLALLANLRRVVLLATAQPDNDDLQAESARAQGLLDAARDDTAEFAALARAAGRADWYVRN